MRSGQPSDRHLQVQHPRASIGASTLLLAASRAGAATASGAARAARGRVGRAALAVVVVRAPIGVGVVVRAIAVRIRDGQSRPGQSRRGSYVLE